MPVFDPHAPCPHNKMKKCSDVRHNHRGCAKWLSMDFTNHKTGETVTEWGCTDFWTPIMSMQAAQEARQGAAATESFRNIMVALNNDRKVVDHQIRHDPLLKKIVTDTLAPDDV